MSRKIPGTGTSQKFNILTLTLGQMESNCYLLFDNQNNTLIIDPGDEADFICQKISGMKLKPKMIVATHGHFDHIMAVLDLQLIFKIPFIVHEKDTFLVSKMRGNAKYFLKIESGPVPDINKFVSSKNLNILADFGLTIIETPGHTPGSICLYLQSQNSLFSGDTYFDKGIYGRTDFSYSSVIKLQESLTKIYQLPKNTIIYPGHGPSVQLASNP